MNTRGYIGNFVCASFESKSGRFHYRVEGRLIDITEGGYIFADVIDITIGNETSLSSISMPAGRPSGRNAVISDCCTLLAIVEQEQNEA